MILELFFDVMERIKNKKKFLKVENYNLVNNEYLLLIDFVFYIVE